MYTIRVDTQRRLLNVEFSGVLATAEALRSMAQAFALADAGSIDACLCDLRTLQRGPGRLLVIAASLAAYATNTTRIGFLARDEQVRFVRRLMRFSGLPHNTCCFVDAREAERWLVPGANALGRRASSTERLHFQQLLAGTLAAPGHAAEESPAA